MTDKWFKAIKITAAVLSLGAAILTDYVGSKTQDEQIKKEVMKAVADIKFKPSASLPYRGGGKNWQFIDNF